MFLSNIFVYYNFDSVFRYAILSTCFLNIKIATGYDLCTSLFMTFLIFYQKFTTQHLPPNGTYRLPYTKHFPLNIHDHNLTPNTYHQAVPINILPQKITTKHLPNIIYRKKKSHQNILPQNKLPPIDFTTKKLSACCEHSQKNLTVYAGWQQPERAINYR